MITLDWLDTVRPLSCRVCGRNAEADGIAQLRGAVPDPIPVTRCRGCGSLDLLPVAGDSSPDDDSIDGYVEAGAGIGTIAECVAAVDPGSVRRFLDVGCNYGFALDLARTLFGWDVVGIEPSLAGRRGARELGLDIRDEYLTPASQLEGGFDLILASEVLEHVPVPSEFLAAIRDRLAPGGRLVITTPAAEIVAPAEPAGEAISALSPGLHTIIATRRGLEGLLRAAGFAAVRVERRRGSLRAVAALEADAELGSPWRQLDAAALERYYARRAGTAAAASPVGVGMAVRLFRSQVAQGRFAESDDSARLVRDAVLRRHGLDLAEPAQLSGRLRDGAQPPWVLPGAAFALGMRALIHLDRPGEALACFELAELAAARWIAAAGVADLDSLDIRAQAAFHRVVALARVDAQAAATAAAQLSDAVGDPDAPGLAAKQCRLLVEVVAHGCLTPDPRLIAIVRDAAPVLVRSSDRIARVAALDALYSLGVVATAAGDERAAAQHLAAAIAECEAQPDEHARALALLCRAAMPARAEPPAEAVAPAPPRLEVQHALDTYWSDASGFFVSGWAHAGAEPVSAITVSAGWRSVRAERNERPDLLEFWPDQPEVVRGGFSAYLPGHPTTAIALSLATESGQHLVDIALPAHPLPARDAASAPDFERVWQRAHAAAPEGPVLLLGARAASEELAEARRRLFPGREVVGFDIHPGIGVDVVGDAHALSATFPEGGFAIVASMSLLEHVAGPWLVARECARVLGPEGIAAHMAPWVWPSHAEPNDFWRFSEQGLAQLFGDEAGFSIVASGGGQPAVVVPEPQWRAQALRMPTTASPATSWIIARRIGPPAEAGGYDIERGRRLAERYPIDGLIPWTGAAAAGRDEDER